MKSYLCLTCFALLGLMVVSTGCGDGNETATKTGEPSFDVAATKAKYEATSEPADAMPVGEAREKSEDGQDVTLVGIVGGSSEPFVEGLAAFTIVDPKVSYCPPEEGCPTPWDYCCTQDQVKGNIATVKIVDDAGKSVMHDAREFLTVKELSTVVVTGKAKRDDQGNLTVAANKVFVRPGQ